MVAPKNSHRQTPRDLSAEDIRLDLDDAYKVIKLSEDLGATDTEVFMVKAIGSDFSIEKDMVKFASAGTEFGIGIRVIKNKRLGFGYCTSLAQAEGAIKNALSTTKLRKEMEFQFTPVTEQREIPSIFDSSILELTVEEGLYSTNQLISSGKELDPRVSVIAGGVGFGGGTIALVTSTGVELKYSSTGIFGGVTTLLKATTVSTGFEFAHSRRNDLAYSELGKTAAELAVNGQNPKPVEPGNYPVIFTPHAISELFEHTIIPGLYGEQAMKGETFYSNRIDEQVASSDISFMDDARFENGI
ncbi:metallopeptidase TldD-related protein, partial [[Eubacterium] cellulosolvens]